ncbi:MAG: type I secretion system permease/ATPase [Candidatus Devosia phytovorans]|uniref:Type I secretion system permease/ATPase n=1 Tax=Candidatus Devosia phytovorans TaxID=3121372 RepID=A0AAJ5VTI3_9HYPH|nr:type I secretion system permease/ATPase [Devosia sp.]WEK03645.1 MAG: type I secretion system permease/ATPase [Devosia sp.]
MGRPKYTSGHQSMVAHARRSIFHGLLYVGILSAFLNALQLLVPLYMLQVHDRVLNSRSLDTLTMLTILVAGGLLLYGFLEYIRSTGMLTLGAQFVRQLNLPLIESSLRSSMGEGSSRATQALRDLSELRGFFATGAAGAPMEAIWSPIFMLTLTAFHPIYGLISLVSAVLIVSLNLIGDLVSRSLLKDANMAQIEVAASVGGSLRQADAIDAMGMMRDLGRRWQSSQNHADHMFDMGMRRNKVIAAASKVVRYGMQVAALGVGAILIIDHLITPGTMMAASILMARTLQPFDSMIENWRQWNNATAAWSRIQSLLGSEAVDRETNPVPTPTGDLVVERLTYAVPGSSTALLKGLDFSLSPGEALGIVGPSATGKSTLARLLVGVLRPNSGGVFLGGHNAFTSERNSFGAAVGYLPQSVSLIEGTILDNISRLREGDPAEVIRAARMSGVHEMIGRLPLGYDTTTGDMRLTLSGGQKQRIGIARAVYGKPRLVVMDEPNANLDAEGEQALLRVIDQLKADGAIVIIIAHRPAILQSVDKLLLLQKDQGWQLGPTAAISAIIGGGIGEDRVAMIGNRK